MLRLLAPLLGFWLWAGTAAAGILDTVKITEGVYAIVGPLGDRNPGNMGNNATFGLVITDDGAVLIDAGASYQGARMLERAIAAITDKPVVVVINTGGQDHRWLGNSYWHDHGARIIASTAAVEDQKARASVQMGMLSELITKFSFAGTEPYYADQTFDRELTFDFGGVHFELTHAPAHTPGDSFVWLPDASVMFTGDIVYRERMLGVIEVSSSADWVASFEAMAAHEPEHVVPGHGKPGDLLSAELDTLDYLINLREQIGAHIAAGGDMAGASHVDQAAFAYLENSETLAGRNALAVFTQMEWE